MKLLLVVVAFFVFTNVNAQDKFLRISNQESNKSSVFKENKRVRVKTIQGGKLNGKLQIVNNQEVMIGKVIIPFSSIKKIKHNPLVANIFISGTLLIIGAYGVLGGLVILAWSGDVIGAAAIGIGAGFGTAGILSPNILRATNIDNQTNFSIETMR